MYYIYTSRLQPLNLLNEEEIKWLCKNIQEWEKVIIGIVNPNPQFPDASDRAESWTRFKLEFNPLTYWERFKIVSEFVERNDLKDKICAIIPLPRPSVDMKKAANYLPTERTMCLTIVHDDDEEENKKIGMEKQGEKIKTIPAYSFNKTLTVISPEFIFSLMAIQNEYWKEMISNNVCEYLETINIKNRVIANLYSEQANEKIKKIFRRAADYDEKMIIYNIIKCSFTDLSKPMSIQSVGYDSKEPLRQLIFNLIIEIKNELPILRIDAPQQYELFNSDLIKLEELYKLITDNTLNNVDRYKIVNKEFEEINVRWKGRNRRS